VSADDDIRSELAGVAASLRAYLEWQEDTGASGIPRVGRRRPAAPADAARPAEPAMRPVPPVTPPVEHAPAPLPEARATEHAPAPLPEARATEHAPAPLPEARATEHAPAEAAPPVDRAARLPVLASEVSVCVKCELAKTRTQTVFARGNPEASLCIIGEAPGADEDAQGLPFVGRAGQLLDRMIAAMGLAPEKDVYVCNIIKCRPPGNRRPEPSEIEACIPYLHEQIALVRPRVIVAMGNTAVSALLGTKLGITKLRGQWKLYRGATLVMPTYHPSYLLRPSAQQAEAKRQAWEDLQLVMKELGLAPPPRRRE